MKPRLRVTNIHMEFIQLLDNGSAQMKITGTDQDGNSVTYFITLKGNASIDDFSDLV